MHDWIMQNWKIIFGIMAGCWCFKWLFCLVFKDITGRWKWEK